MSDPLYLDYAATTPLDPGVVAAMLPWLSAERAGNANARHHLHGNAAHQAVQKARVQIATAIGGGAEHLVFTSGATEANNLVLQGLRAHLKATGRTHIITSAVEHKSILSTLDALAAEGFTVTVLPVKPCGMIEARMIEAALTPETGLVCVQAVNNELGVIQPIDEISAMLKGRDVLLHVDAAQALGKTPLDVVGMGADFMTLSAHKAYGPQGVGAVYGRLDLLQGIQHGGSQEKSLRAGTLPVFLCVGFGTACALLNDDRARLQGLREILLARLAPFKPEIGGHADPVWNVPGILNIRFPGIDHDALVMVLPGLSFGTGAACTDGKSHVALATTGSEQAAAEAIRLSFGRFTTQNDIERAADAIVAAVHEIQIIKGLKEAV